MLTDLFIITTSDGNSRFLALLKIQSLPSASNPQYLFWLFFAKYPSVLQAPNWRPECLCMFGLETISADHLQGHLLFHSQLSHDEDKR
jgi:hypothetical protein